MIITLSREGGIDFTPLLQELKAKELPVLDSDTLQQEQAQIGKNEYLLEHFGEHSPRFRDLWGVHKDYYLSFLRLSIYRFALKGSGLIYGHGASFILAGIPAVLKIKLIAPEDFRIEVVSKAKGVSHNEAKHLIHKRERERLGFHRFFFDADWNDDACYDVILNIASNNFYNILDLVSQTKFPVDAIERCSKILKNYISAEELSMEILFEEKLFIDLLKIDMDHELKSIGIRGIISDIATKIRAKDIVNKRFPDYNIESNLELMQSNFPYFPSV